MMKEKPLTIRIALLGLALSMVLTGTACNDGSQNTPSSALPSVTETTDPQAPTTTAATETTAASVPEEISGTETTAATAATTTAATTERDRITTRPPRTTTTTTTTASTTTTAPTEEPQGPVEEPNPYPVEAPKNRYITFFTGNDENLVKQVYGTFGPNKHGEYQVAIGVGGPNLLVSDKQDIVDLVDQMFDLAEAYDYPCYFQLDDQVGLGYDAISVYGTKEKTADNWIYDNIDMVEWYNFPTEKGGTGQQARFWFNWGSWLCVPGFPCYNSPTYLEFLTRKLSYFTEAVNARYEKLKAEGKEYLFAGVATGWETGVPSYEDADPNNPYVDVQTGDAMKSYEYNRLGYHMLYNKGWTQAKLEIEAERRGMTFDELWAEEIAACQQEYSSFICRYIIEHTSIPRIKINTHVVGTDSMNVEDTTNTAHPRISTAVNPYSTPGFTMSGVSAPYNVIGLLEKIRKEDPEQIYFVNAEGYATGLTDDPDVPYIYFDEMFSNGCTNVTIFGYNYDDPDGVGGGYYCPRDPAHPFNQAIMEYLNR